MVKTYIKSKSAPNATGPKYRTPDHFKSRSRFGKSSREDIGSKKANPQPKFNPAQFKVQHKG